jgi:hypothetical protein
LVLVAQASACALWQPLPYEKLHTLNSLTKNNLIKPNILTEAAI